MDSQRPRYEPFVGAVVPLAQRHLPPRALSGDGRQLGAERHDRPGKDRPSAHKDDTGGGAHARGLPNPARALSWVQRRTVGTSRLPTSGGVAHTPEDGQRTPDQIEGGVFMKKSGAL